MDHFDYAKNEDLEYFSSQLERLNLDIICLQESQFNNSDSFAKRLATSLGFNNVAETPGCPSHIDQDYRITTAILSRVPSDSTKYFLLPYPDFQLIHDGKLFSPYDRYLLRANFGNFCVATTHPEPLEGMFNLVYESGKGNKLAKDIDEIISSKLCTPTVIAADYNINDVYTVLPKSTKKLKLREALPLGDTIPQGGFPDHISYSDDFSVIASGIVQTKTDHYLCWAELELV